MNPVTRRLLENIDNPELADFAMAWDKLEEQVIGMYRGVVPLDEAAFKRTLRSTARLYRGWAKALAPHWQATEIAGAPVEEDPFTHVLRLGGAQGVLDDWRLMQTLPAAREALNHLLLERAVG